MEVILRMWPGMEERVEVEPQCGYTIRKAVACWTGQRCDPTASPSLPMFPVIDFEYAHEEPGAGPGLRVPVFIARLDKLMQPAPQSPFDPIAIEVVGEDKENDLA